MRRTLIATLIASTGLGGLAYGQLQNVSLPYPGVTVGKAGILSVSLNNQFQGYEVPPSSKKWGVQINPTRLATPARTWDNQSYTYISNCLGTVTYRSYNRGSTWTKIDNKRIIDVINAALSRTVSVAGVTKYGPLVGPNSIYAGKFSTTAAKIVVVNYDNRQEAPPYPPTEDTYYDPATAGTAVWNAPYNLAATPAAVDDGTKIQLVWPNKNYIAWGRPWVDNSLFPPVWNWAGNKVYIIDSKNANTNLRCFDVTPFFALEESYCWFCWDTMDRVTDGSITAGTTVSDPPCATGGAACGRKGSGTTKLFWTLKFNNVSIESAKEANNVLKTYFDRYLVGSTLADWFYGVTLDDTKLGNQGDVSTSALSFAVNGIATYKWSYKTLQSTGFSAPMGTFNMGTSAGYGYSPMCGVFNGPVSLTEYDKSNSVFGGVACW